jgi:hypothetical protein
MARFRYWYAVTIATTVILLFYYTAAAQNNYNAASVPDSIKKNANAVIIEEINNVSIESNGKYVMSVHKAVEILNENGQDEASVILPYDKFSKVNNLSAKLYKADGSQIKNKNLTEAGDFGYTSDGTLYSDMRYKAIAPQWNEYPYIAVIDFTYTINEGISYPGWNPVGGFDVSVINSEFIVRISPNLNLRYFEKNLNKNCTSAVNTDHTLYTWTLSNQTALKEEPYSPEIDEIMPDVLLSPSMIDFNGYKGDLLSWSNFGLWIASLNKGTDNLEAVTVEKIKTLTSGLPTKKEKVKAVYEYMQNKTRYVNITVGIGGLKPINAADVDRLGYGDCKALSNYTKALLTAAGIKSYYTLVQDGEEKPKTEDLFPSQQFNHAILCVPDENDTIWLECTNQFVPFNFLGKFTSDRNVLLITEEGGKLVRTPAFHRGENLRSRNITVVLDETGNGTAAIRTKYSGDFYDDYLSIVALDKEGQKKVINENLHIPKYEFKDFSVIEIKEGEPFATENINVNLISYFTNAANKKIMQLNLMSKIEYNPFNSRNRSTDIVFTWPYKTVDTVTYKLPEGYSPEKLPQPVNLSYDFANYRNEATMTGGNLMYIRTLELIPGHYKKDRYKEFSAFFDKVASSDAMKIAIIPNQ